MSANAPRISANDRQPGVNSSANTPNAKFPLTEADFRQRSNLRYANAPPTTANASANTPPLKGCFRLRWSLPEHPR